MSFNQAAACRRWNWDRDHTIYVSRAGRKFHFNAQCGGFSGHPSYAVRCCICMPVISMYDEELWVSDVDQFYHRSCWPDRYFCDEQGIEDGYIRRILKPCQICTAAGQYERAAGSIGI